MFRRTDKNDPNVFTLVGQTVFEVKDDGVGALLIDVAEEPLQVLKGDVIGFHVINNGAIPYDIDINVNEPMYILSLENWTPSGNTLKMKQQVEPKRLYSLMANIVDAGQSSSIIKFSFVFKISIDLPRG